MTPTPATLEDYRWLIGPQAAPWLEEAAAESANLLRLATQMRKTLSPARAGLVLEQAELRRKGREKFSAAGAMFFTRLALEQATDEIVAAYKASRFPGRSRVADLCCGIGGDLLALARRGPALGVDRHPIAALLAEANCRACGVPLDASWGAGVLAADVLAAPLEGCAAMHLDPDRRPAGRRTTRVELHEPGLSQIEQLRARLPNLALKLAPAADPPDVWRQEAHWEWISRGGECRQLVAWFGSLAPSPGLRQATVLGSTPQPLRCVSGQGQPDPPPASRIGRYLYEPDAAVLAAGLTGDLAAEHSLMAVSAGIAYLTADALVPDAALAAFEIEEVLPLDLKKLRGLLRERGIGRLEIKKRSVPADPEGLRRQLALRGDGQATLVLTRRDRQTLAILCHRLPALPEAPR
jgi:hypothetical protein